MSAELAEQTFRRIEEHVRENELPAVAVTFHGGEPLLVGPARMKQYIELAKQHISCKLDLSIQTNGTLLTEEFLNLLAEHGVRIGISLDGDREENDRHRRFHNGRSSFDAVCKAVDLINMKPEWSALLGGYLAVVDIENDPQEVYNFLSGIDSRGFDLLLPDCNHDSPPPRPADDAENTVYGRWMAKVFDAWLESGKNVEIRYFEEIMAMLCGQRSMMEHIGAHFVDLIIVETDGEIESVDTLKMVGREATSLGLNVADDGFSDALKKEAIYSRFSGFKALCTTCQSCSLVNQCGGGYLPHRFSSELGFQNPSVYCNDIKYLIGHIVTSLEQELSTGA